MDACEGFGKLFLRNKHWRVIFAKEKSRTVVRLMRAAYLSSISWKMDFHPHQLSEHLWMLEQIFKGSNILHLKINILFAGQDNPRTAIITCEDSEPRSINGTHEMNISAFMVYHSAGSMHYAT